MGRKVMDNGFRRIKAAPVATEPDPRLALVDLFRDTQVFRPEGFQTSGTIDLAAPLPEGVIDLSSGSAQDYSAFFVEDSQEPVVEPEPVSGDAAPVEDQKAVEEAPVQPEPVEKVEPQEQVQNEKDYDPIAAVLG